MPRLNYNQDGSSEFGKIHLSEAQNCIHLIHERKLLPRDFVILFALISCMNAKTGKIKFVLKTLSEEVKMHSSTVAASIKRLKDEFLIAKIVERNESYYLINPHLVSVGSENKWENLHSLFTNAFE